MHSDIHQKQEEFIQSLVPIDPDTVAELQSSAPSEELVAVVAGTFQALGDPTRLKILYALVKRSCCVRDPGRCLRIRRIASDAFLERQATSEAATRRNDNLLLFE